MIKQNRRASLSTYPPVKFKPATFNPYNFSNSSTMLLSTSKPPCKHSANQTHTIIQPIMEISNFAEMQEEFMSRIQKAVYCNVATVDRKGRPRSRVMHPIWDGPIGWVISWPESHKTKHLQNNPYVSLAYIQDAHKPVYVDAMAEWINDVNEKLRLWELHKSTPAPLGFDPEPHYGSIDDKYFGLLRFSPWRITLGDLNGEPMIWRQK